jgi:hypothetical protein
MDDAGHLEFALRADRRAVLMTDGVPLARRTVIDPVSSRLVLPVPSSALAAEDAVIWIPEERDDAVQVLVSFDEIDGRSEPAADRWRIYHGREPDAHWIAAGALGVRLGPIVADGDELDLSNPLAEAEARLCKRFNASPGELGRLAHAFDRRAHGACTLVGVDYLGLDLRTRFDIVRVPFGEPLRDPDAAERRITELLDRHAGDAA